MVAVAAGLGLLASNWLLPDPVDGSVVMAPGGSAAAEAARSAAGAASASEVPALAPGDVVPALQLDGLDGVPIQLEQLRGRPVLINVWASWCAPCVEEMPELARFAAAQPDDGVQVIGLALDDAESVRAFLQRVPVGYPIALDTPAPDDASVALGNARGLLPYTVLIDAQGRMLKNKLGPFEHGEIEGWVGKP